MWVLRNPMPNIYYLNFYNPLTYLVLSLAIAVVFIAGGIDSVKESTEDIFEDTLWTIKNLPPIESYDVIIIHFDGQPMKSWQHKSREAPEECGKCAVYKLGRHKFTNVERVFVTRRISGGE